MDIRQLNKDDALIWKTHRLEALKHHPENYLSSFEEESELSDANWQQRIEEHMIFGLFEEGALVSMVSFSLFPRIKSRHKGEIWGVYTIPSARGKGYSKQLMLHVLAFAKDIVSQCILTCTTTNTSAFHIYDKLGFKVYGIEPKAITVHQQLFDEYLMIKEF